MKKARALGIDFGERRIGLALSDPEGRYALPFKTVERETDRRAIHRLAAIARQESVELLVLGEPLGLNGKAGPNALRARRFGERLAKVTGLPIRFVNEALTTVEATARLDHRRQPAGGRRRQLADGRDHRTDHRDEVAAQIILQEALDHPPEELS